MNEKMTNYEAYKVLVAVKTKMGRRYKTFIRDAWLNGDYENHGLGEWSQSLQQIRNQLGPVWLQRVYVYDGKK